MLQFLTRRLILLVPVVLGLLLITFIIVRLIPGDPCKAFLGERATEAKCAEFRERYGLNDSVPVQFLRYLGNLVQGDLGMSVKTSQPVVDVIAQRLPMTMELAMAAMLFAVTGGVVLGVISALRRNSTIDVITMVIANIGVSMPVFWLGLMLAFFFALVLKDTFLSLPPSARLSAGVSVVSLATHWGLTDLQGLPRFIIMFLSNSVIFSSIVRGDWAMLGDATRHLILPAIAVGTIPLAVIARMTRSSMLEVLGLDYVRTARAKGLVERMVLSKHAFRNALIPIVTIIGLETGALLSGAVLTETVFALPGVGTQLVTAISARDYSVVQGFTVVIALIFVVVNLLVDLSYAYLDPRIRLD